MSSLATQVPRNPRNPLRWLWRFRRIWAVVVVISVVLVAVAVCWRASATPDSIPAEFSKAWELFELGRNVDAKNHLDVLMQKKHEGNAYLILDAALCVAENNFEAAEKRIAAANLKGALRPFALEVLGKSFLGQKRWYEAERAFATLAHEVPQSHLGHYWLGVVYYELHMFGQAIKEVRLATELQPDEARAHSLLGLILLRVGRYRVAAEQYQLAIRSTPTGSGAVNSLTTSLVNCLIQSGQFDAALQAIANINEPSTELQTLRAECLLGVGQLAEAERECRAILEHDSNQKAAVITLVKVGLQQTVTPEHAQLLEDALSKHSNNYDLLFLLAQVYGRLGNIERQQELLTQSQRLAKLQVRSLELMDDVWSKPDDVDSRLELAALFDEMGESDQAKQWRQAAVGCQQRLKAIQGNTP